MPRPYLGASNGRKLGQAGFRGFLAMAGRRVLLGGGVIQHEADHRTPPLEHLVPDLHPDRVELAQFHDAVHRLEKRHAMRMPIPTTSSRALILRKLSFRPPQPGAYLAENLLYCSPSASVPGASFFFRVEHLDTAHRTSPHELDAILVEFKAYELAAVRLSEGKLR